VSDRAGYTAFLSVMERALVRYGAALDRSSELAGLPQRAHRLVDALRSDLEHLGRPTAPVCAPSEIDVDDASAWGVGYVFEGSALGAAFLVRDVPDTLRSVADCYLSLLVDERVERWSTFTDRLNDLDVESVGPPAVDAAIDVFVHLESLFDAYAAEAVTVAEGVPHGG